MVAPHSPPTLRNLSKLPDNGKLFIRTTRSDGKTKEAHFDLGNLSDIRKKIARRAIGMKRLRTIRLDRLINQRIVSLFLSRSQAAPTVLFNSFA